MSNNIDVFNNNKNYITHTISYCLGRGSWKCWLFYDPSLTHKGGGPGVNLTSYLDSSHMVSQYLLIHSKALKARIKEIKGKNTKSAIL